MVTGLVQAPPTAQTLRRYHMTEEDWNILGEAQAWLCALCHKPAKTRFVIDHCHKTNRVRGLIHPMCNGRLGKVKDDAAWCEDAVEYLRRPPAYWLLTEGHGFVTVTPKGRTRRTPKR